jgi:hypothetical protein
MTAHKSEGRHHVGSGNNRRRIRFYPSIVSCQSSSKTDRNLNKLNERIGQVKMVS